MASAFGWRLPIRSQALLQSAKTVADHWMFLMRRRAKPLIALATAYGMMLAAVFGAVSASQSAVLGTSFCSTSSPAGDQAPVLHARHDLDCCIACCSGPAALPAPAANMSIPALTPIAWLADEADFFCLPINGSPFARAPPVRI
jgi:hypothetical protein